MATIKGKEGVFKIGTVVVGEVKSFELNVTANKVDRSVMGMDWTRAESTQNSWTLSADLFADSSDDGQALLVVGSKVNVKLYSAGDGTGLQEDAGVGLVTSISRSQSHDGLVELTVELDGDGDLVTSTVV